MRATAASLRDVPRWPPVIAALLGIGVLGGLSNLGISPGTGALYIGALVCAACSAYVVWYAEPAHVLCVALLASPFSGNWGALGVPSLIAPDRLLLLAAVVTLVVRAPGARDRPPFRLEPVHLLLILISLYGIASAATVGTLGDSAAVFRLVDRFGLVPFAMFAVAPLAFYTERHRRALMTTLVALGAYLGITAIFETIGPHSLVFPSFINNSALGLHAGRARGPFLEAEAEGIALVACGIAAIMALRAWRSMRSRVFAAVVVATCGAGAFLTLQRGVWLGGIGAAVVVLASVRELRRFLLPSAAAIAILVVGLLTLVPGLSDRAGQRLNGRNARLSVYDRRNQDAAAIRMIQAHPLFGVGWQKFQDRVEPYFRASPDYPLTGSYKGRIVVVHNVFLSNAAELGLVGAVLWLSGLAVALGAAVLRRVPPELEAWRLGLAALVAMWATVALLTPLQKPFANLLLWLWAGLVYARPWPDERAAR